MGRRKLTLQDGIIINIGKDEFIAIGKDYSPTTRRLNGDEGKGGGDYGFGF